MRLHPFTKGAPVLPTVLYMLVRMYLLLVVVLWLGQEVLLFPGVWLLRGENARDPGWGEILEAARDDGSTVPVRLANPGQDRIVVITHGNGEAAAQLGEYAAVLGRAGWTVAAMEFRGYAQVAGWPTESRLAADLRSTISALEAAGYSRDRMVLHGRSIGGGVAGTWLDTGEVAGLVLESSFSSLSDVVNTRWVGWIAPTGLLLRSPFPTAARLARRPVPVFQVHDTTDHVIGVELTERITVPSIERHLTTGYPHGAPIVLMEPAVRTAWLGWLERLVPVR